MGVESRPKLPFNNEGVPVSSENQNNLSSQLKEKSKEIFGSEIFDYMVDDAQRAIDYVKTQKGGVGLLDALSNKQVLLVDDDKLLTSGEWAKFFLATGGHADALITDNPTAEELISEIAERNPQVLLLDNDLGSLYGHQLVPGLKRKAPATTIIGHSAQGSVKEFERQGVACAHKRTKESVYQVAQIVAKQEEKKQ